MLMGDLNCTSWSPYFQDMLSESGLRGLAAGLWRARGAGRHLPLPLRIPIDHCLMTPDVSIKAPQNRR